MEDMTFEQALARLEEIVKALEDGSAPLDDALTLYEEGVALVKRCSEQLDCAERRIRVLQKNGDGNYDEHDFTADPQ